MAGEEERNEKNIKEIMIISFQNLMKTINLQLQEPKQTPSIRTMKKSI